VSAAEDLLFPYMVWAHTRSSRSPWCLSQSGMPMADPALFAPVGPPDLGHASAEALPALERRLAELFHTDPERVLVTLGASGAMHLAAQRFFRAPARVAVEVPSYEALRGTARLAGAELRPLYRRLETGWDADPEEARAHLAGAGGPGHVFVTNLHNPTGARLSADRLRELAAVAAGAGGVLVSCEVYMEYVPNERRVHAFALSPNAISIGSLTKAYGLGALRIGWILLGEGLAHERAHLVDLAYLTWVDPPTPTLRAALFALEHLEELRRPLARVEAESRPVWERWLAETPGVQSTVPEHGIIAFPRVRDADDTLALAAWLQEEHRVDVVPGEFFALPGHLRVGCGVPAATLEEGLARLALGIEAWRAR
jgi:aspartate/methionine/tyrosine aminotransferase